VSLDAQRAKVKAYAELYDLESADMIVDAGESAKSLDRPGLQRALAMLKAERPRRFWWSSWTGSPGASSTSAA
jgi:DNA invertase Pin-like site-specific DNA recombinase